MSDLPRPVTVSDKYLARILAQLERLEDRLTAPAAPPPAAPAADAGHVELREPQSPPGEPQSLLTPLPEDFPGRVALNEAGIIYLETVPTNGAALTAVPGIGPKTANAILTYFKTQ